MNEKRYCAIPHGVSADRWVRVFGSGSGSEMDGVYAGAGLCDGEKGDRMQDGEDHGYGEITSGKAAAGVEATDELVEADFNAGRFLRTHVLRPTWDFVAPQDIRWMLALTAPRIRSFAQSHHRQLAIDAAMLKKSRKVIAKALAGGPMDRKELQDTLANARIRTDEAWLGFLLLDAELDGLVCSAGRRDKQFLYGLLEEIVPSCDPLEGLFMEKINGREFWMGRDCGMDGEAHEEEGRAPGWKGREE